MRLKLLISAFVDQRWYCGWAPIPAVGAVTGNRIWFSKPPRPARVANQGCLEFQCVYLKEISMFSTVQGLVYLRDINAKQVCVLGNLRNFGPRTRKNKNQKNPYLHAIPLKPKGIAYSFKVAARHASGDSLKSAQ